MTSRPRLSYAARVTVLLEKERSSAANSPKETSHRRGVPAGRARVHCGPRTRLPSTGRAPRSGPSVGGRPARGRTTPDGSPPVAGRSSPARRGGGRRIRRRGGRAWVRGPRCAAFGPLIQPMGRRRGPILDLRDPLSGNPTDTPNAVRRVPVKLGRSPSKRSRGLRCPFENEPSGPDPGPNSRLRGWRESIGIEPTHRPLRTDAPVLKTGGATRPPSSPEDCGARGYDGCGGRSTAAGGPSGGPCGTEGRPVPGTAAPRRGPFAMSAPG